MLPLAARKGLLTFSVVSVTLWTAAHISSSIGYTPKKQVRTHKADLQLQHLPPLFSCRNRLHIQGQILPAPLWAPRESRKKSPCESLVDHWGLCRKMESREIHWGPYTVGSIAFCPDLGKTSPFRRRRLPLKNRHILQENASSFPFVMCVLTALNCSAHYSGA